MGYYSSTVLLLGEFLSHFQIRKISEFCYPVFSFKGLETIKINNTRMAIGKAVTRFLRDNVIVPESTMQIVLNE